jgi:hypothetical protein
MERNGLSILNILKIFKNPEFAEVKSNIETTTTKKSSLFQESRKYDFECKTKPKARILKTHSMKKIIESTIPI